MARDIEREKARQKAYREANREREYKRQKAWREANKEQMLNKLRAYAESLPAPYVASRLGMKTAECQPELIELKREQIAMLRLVKQLNKVIKEKTNDE